MNNQMITPPALHHVSPVPSSHSVVHPVVVHPPTAPSVPTSHAAPPAPTPTPPSSSNPPTGPGNPAGSSSGPPHVSAQGGVAASAPLIIYCGLCEGNRAAAMFCPDCGVSICSFHVEAHQKTKTTSYHHLMNLMDAKATGFKRTHPTCTRHKGEDLRLICKDCAKSICRDCVLVDCKGHQVVFIDEVTKQERPQDIIQQARKRRQVLQQAALDVGEMLKKVDTRSQDVVTQVKSGFEVVEREVEQQRALLLEQVEHSRVAKHNVLQHQRDSLMTAISSFDAALHDDDSCVDLEIVKGALQKATSIVERPQEDDTLNFVCDLHAFRSALPSVGRVVTSQSLLSLVSAPKGLASDPLRGAAGVGAGSSTDLVPVKKRKGPGRTPGTSDSWWRDTFYTKGTGENAGMVLCKLGDCPTNGTWKKGVNTGNLISHVQRMHNIDPNSNKKAVIAANSSKMAAVLFNAPSINDSMTGMVQHRP